jgi:hypothetical protein
VLGALSHSGTKLGASLELSHPLNVGDRLGTGWDCCWEAHAVDGTPLGRRSGDLDLHLGRNWVQHWELMLGRRSGLQETLGGAQAFTGRTLGDEPSPALGPGWLGLGPARTDTGACRPKSYSGAKLLLGNGRLRSTIRQWTEQTGRCL